LRNISAYQRISFHDIGGHYAPIVFASRNHHCIIANIRRLNHYDRIGHLTQGFVPAIVTREILLRQTPLLPGKMLFFLVVSVCLAASAFYEFIEWWVALLTGDAADAFLGSQGDVWDTQWDMFCCFLGSIAAQLLLAKTHDRALARLREEG